MMFVNIFKYTLEPFYKTVHYKTVLNIRRCEAGFQTFVSKTKMYI